MPRYGMVIDLDRCTGCRACVEACKVENNTPEAVFWMHVFRFEEGQYPTAHGWFMPRPCMHCDNPPCAKVCPVGARYQRRDGLVATDSDRCIGCRYCEVACPYGVNFFNWKRPDKAQYHDWNGGGAGNGETPPYRNPDLAGRYGAERRRTAGGGHAKGVVEKCTFCVHRIEKNLAPACVANCPMSAMQFGDLDDPNSTVSRLLHRKAHAQLLEELGTKPRVFYTGGRLPGAHARQIEGVKGRA